MAPSLQIRWDRWREDSAAERFDRPSAPKSDYQPEIRQPQGPATTCKGDPGRRYLRMQNLGYWRGWNVPSDFEAISAREQVGTFFTAIKNDDVSAIREFVA